MKLKIAFLQLVSEGNLEDNLEKGIKACREAKANGADIALFPEMWSSGYTFPHNKEWLEQNSISLNSKYVKQFSEICLKLDLAIAITLLESMSLSLEIQFAYLIDMESWYIVTQRYISVRQMRQKNTIGS